MSESMPKQNNGLSEESESLLADWDAAYDMLDADEVGEVNNATVSENGLAKSSKDVQEYLKDNFNRLSETQKAVLLQSIRVNEYKEKNKTQ